jgi:hypothetical protein
MGLYYCRGSSVDLKSDGRMAEVTNPYLKQGEGWREEEWGNSLLAIKKFTLSFWSLKKLKFSFAH